MPRWILSLIAAAVAAGPVQAMSLGCDIGPDAVLAEVNALRALGAVCGSRGRFAATPPLSWNSALDAMARQQATWLAFTDRLSHTGPQGQTLAERAQAEGYRFARIAENLAQGQHTLADALRDWTRSESHCVNLYGAAYTQTALACQPAADGRPLWVMVYARPN